ncbi:Tetratricopeptide repeat-containing protein [Octadecabacter temperatus]|uniref:Tetratricopeptide repeat protein n=1 Tax=Octadecabacter temperatus TaxID=1458307 RepID=A0A0K0Y343_9RHOB|nr:tetratricopeptide repeat protein [Octadecabacter temperatus]AKS45287.1 Tetratricopeptide repeat protein [Octadecabacter temperatus]SIN89840.1 Tetratricopeptide repeat-containing protein [Octadecabacter temperatus]
MRHPIVISAALMGTLALAACDQSGEAQVERALQDVNVVDETNLNDVMLTVADPNEAVNYFLRASTNDPGRIDLMRGLGKSLIRARRPAEAAAAWKSVVEHEDSTLDDRIDLADALIRTNDWTAAEEVLDQIPPTHETYKRYRLEAMVADSNEEWDNADSFYETAAGLTTSPAGVLNNWGFSKLTRGDYSGAERLFTDALRNDSDLFTAKNNLVLARGAQRNYDLPVIQMSQVERAQLLHTLALTAIKQNDLTIGRGLLREAIDTHPQHFEAAVRSLRALEDNVTN